MRSSISVARWRSLQVRAGAVTPSRADDGDVRIAWKCVHGHSSNTAVLVWLNHSFKLSALTSPRHCS